MGKCVWLIWRDRAIGLKLNHRRHFLPPFRVGQTDHTGFSHGRMLPQCRFHLGRIDVFPARNDQITATLNQPQIPIIIAIAEGSSQYGATHRQ